MTTPLRGAIIPSAIGLAAALVGLSLVSGHAIADPQSRPAITAAPYVLKSTLLEEGPTRAYRPWFENGVWTGDLIEYTVSSAGERCTSVAVGEFPAEDDRFIESCPPGNWSARGQLPDRILQGNLLVDTQEMEEYWQDRFVFMYDSNPLDTNNRVDFWWDELSDAQKHALDPNTCPLQGDDCEVEDADGTDLTKKDASGILNFIRGDRSDERFAGGVYRTRYSLLGAIINSRPVYVPAGDRDGLVVVGSNNGMVQGFDARDGTELFGYIPSMFLPNLSRLTEPGLEIPLDYFADGELRYRNIRSANGPDKHIVTGGFGAGAKGLFIMDVSNPADPRVLRELSGSEDPDDHIAGTKIPSLGHIYGRPTIARLNDDHWYVVTGNGYFSGNGAALVLIRLSDGQVREIGVGDDGVGDDDKNGLSAPALFDVNNDGRANYAYAGDLNGTLWRFKLDPKGGGAVPGTSTELFSAGSAKPITVEPEIARHSTGLGIMVYFGTGKLLTSADSSDTSQQSFYGLWDENFTASNINPNRLISQKLVQETDSWAEQTRTVRIVERVNGEESQPDWQGGEGGANKTLGWQVDFPPASGERLIGRPQVRADRIQFITTNPTSDPLSDEPGDGSWFVQLSLDSGGSLNPAVPLYDLDRSGELDEADAITIDIEGDDGTIVPTPFYPLALNLGAGNIAQPAFARVLQDIDAVFINAFLLLPPSDPDPAMALGGDMDVTTDSPSGPLVNPHRGEDPDRHPEYDLYGEAYPDPWSTRSPPARGPMNIHLASDGFGNQVDGHHRAYNRVHGVNYVDYINLEPRRGQYRLDPGPIYTFTDENGEEVKEPFIAIQELNGPTDDLYGEPMFGADQKFIVVLTNADLSQGTELQIGCRRWNTFDYQQMITGQLKAQGQDNQNPDALQDTYHDNRPLVFTINEILNDTGCNEPTLRITVTARVGDPFVLHGTLPGCVNNTHQYNGQLKVAGTHPHITENNEHRGPGGPTFRWRNGALTMQLLAVGTGNTSNYQLQWDRLPISNQPVLGNGGIFARGFTSTQGGNPTITPVTGANNGLLYESSVFWNWGDMWEFQQQGELIPCYGHPYYGAAETNEQQGLNVGQYQQLTAELSLSDLSIYDAAMRDLLAGNNIENALITLAGIFGNLAGSWQSEQYTLGDYHIMRNYIATQHNIRTGRLDNVLLDIDRSLVQPPLPVDLGIDGTPARVEDIELDLLPAAGPNYAPGRRSWIDITPN